MRYRLFAFKQEKKFVLKSQIFTLFGGKLDFATNIPDCE